MTAFMSNAIEASAALAHLIAVNVEYEVSKFLKTLY
jgi:hypothetical protein